MYIVANCPRCGNLLLAKATNKTRLCPHCGFRSQIRSLRVLAEADSTRQAVSLIQSLKRKRMLQK
ncbi:MAG: DUF1922 domain-containing protein [Candidatus Bathyarchaeia archaeon]